MAIQTTAKIKEKIRVTVKTLFSNVVVVRILILTFGAAGDDDQAVEIEAEQAATYVSNTLTNVATVVYKVNTVVKTLPFTVVATDDLEVIITRTVPATLSKVKLST